MGLTGQLSGQRVLVTGASGFLGRHLCYRLHTSGADVHAIVRNPPLDGGPCPQWWKGDIGDIETVRQLFAAVKPHIVFHMTSHGFGAPDLQYVLPTFHSDLLAAVNVLTVATQCSCSRVVVTASLEEPQPGSEDITPSSPYAAAKWASSAYAQMFHRLYGTPVVIVRPFMTYGPGQREHKLIPYVTLELLQGRVPKLSSGRRPVDWIYVDDVIEGMLAAVQKGDIDGRIIDLGSGTLIPIHEVVKQLVAVVGTAISPCFGALPERPFEKVRVADTDYTYNKLGWKAETPLKQGLDKTVQWYREQLSCSSSNNVLRL
jgi:UDP-glucose 4-epimerase